MRAENRPTPSEGTGQCNSRQPLTRARIGTDSGFAFLRKSHGGCGAPLAPRQEPPFESILKMEIERP